MKISASVLSRAAALMLAAGLPLCASAQTAPGSNMVAAPPAHLTTPHPVRVQTCSPQKNTYYSSVYTPAYYPAGMPYWGWGSVYGPAYSYYSYPVEGNPTLQIDYHNATHVTMKEIEFGLIAHGQLVAEVRDVGTFSPGAEIKHSFGLNPNVFPLQTAMVECIPLKIVYSDGSKWKNPHLPALRKQIYGKPH